MSLNSTLWLFVSVNKTFTIRFFCWRLYWLTVYVIIHYSINYLEIVMLHELCITAMLFPRIYSKLVCAAEENWSFTQSFVLFDIFGASFEFFNVWLLSGFDAFQKHSKFSTRAISGLKIFTMEEAVFMNAQLSFICADNIVRNCWFNFTSVTFL